MIKTLKTGQNSGEVGGNDKNMNKMVKIGKHKGKMGRNKGKSEKMKVQWGKYD